MNHRPDTSVTHRLTFFYCIALGIIALTAIGGQLLMQELIFRQRNDSTVINVAGRQRMLSQRIAKAALAAARAGEPAERENRRGELRQSLDLWTAAHESLLQRSGPLAMSGENSPAIRRSFDALEPVRREMIAACESLFAALERGSRQPDIDQSLSALLAAEGEFLRDMDAIVLQYEAEAHARVDRLRRVEAILLAITLTVLALEALLIFRPVVRRIRETMRRFQEADTERGKATAQLATIFDTVPALIVFLDREGKILRANKLAAEIIGEPPARLHGTPVYQWFPGEAERLHEEDAWILANGAPRVGLLHMQPGAKGEARWLRTSKVPYRDADGSIAGSIMFAVDVSAHKRLEIRLMELRAEEERKLGYDLHDGLGQELSGILYLSRRLENKLRDRAAGEAEGASEIVNLVKAAIENVRNLSQGLRPLGDEPRALAQAVAEVARHTQQITGLSCSFQESGTVLIFESDVAEHLFRIAQEAINNAVRHSGCTHIGVELRQGDDVTTLEIRDDGKGFDREALRAGRSSGEPEGLGLSIMQHRAELMGGTFSIESSAAGTTVRCTLKV